MKTFTSLVLSAALAAGALSAQAAEPGEGYLEVCKSQLKDYYGQDTELDLVAKRRFPDGVRMRVAARMDQDNSRFATCWVANEDVQSFEINQTRNMVAATAAVPASQ